MHMSEITRGGNQSYELKLLLFVLIGMVVWILVFYLCRYVWPIEPYRCSDGWVSSSIGIQGACSHHGGVVGGDTMPWQIKWLCPIIGLITFYKLSVRFIDLDKKTADDPDKRGDA